MNNVGLSIVEGVSNGASPFKEPSKRNIGLLLQSNRGIPGTAVKISSLEEFNVLFGGANSSFYGPAVVKSIFDEAGNAPVTLYLSRVVGEGSAVASKVITLSGGETVDVRAAYHGVEDPGTWGNSIKVILYSFGSAVKDAFYFKVLKNGSQVEAFADSTLALIQDSVNRVSKYVSVDFSGEITKLNFSDLDGTITSSTSSNTLVGVGTDFLTSLLPGNVIYFGDKIVGTVDSITDDTHAVLKSKAFVGETAATMKKRLDVTYEGTLVGGTDEAVVESDFYPVEGAEPKGLATFNGVDVQLLACTEFHSLSMAKVMNDYVQTKKVAIGLINLPFVSDEGTAELFAIELQTADKSFLTGILGWVKVLDSQGNSQFIPAIGAVLGAGYLRTPYINGNYIHIPPAGIDSMFSRVVDVYPKNLQQSTINKVVREFTCNIIQSVENVGFYVGTSRTYSTNSLYQSVHIRQQTSFYIRQLTNLFKYLEQKPNTVELRREALVNLRSFFKLEYDNGALETSVPFEEAFVGICDSSNNPATQDRKDLNIEAQWIPTEVVEGVKINLNRNDGVLTVTEK
jgi:hypothetical protein